MIPILNPLDGIKNGQCLPGALALLFDNAAILKEWQPKTRGYLMTEITNILSGKLVGDCVCRCKPEDVTTYIELSLQHDISEGVMCPFIFETANHAILTLINPHNNDVYWYDVLRMKCGKSTLSKIDFKNTLSVWCIRETVSNSMLGIHLEDLKHILR